MGDKALAQLREETAAKLREWFLGQGMNLAHYDSAARFDSWCTEDAADMIVALFTEGWSVSKDQRHLDKCGTLRDPSAPLERPGDDYDVKQATDVVVYKIETPPRLFTEQEAAAKAEREAQWQARRARERAIWNWKNSDLSEPPPDGIGIDNLLDQVVWWVTKDGRALRIGEMTPSHRANLHALMIRNARAWKDSQLGIFFGAPDGVFEAFEALSPQEWLDEKRLFTALRRLIMQDFAGEDACLIEWGDTKPVPCIPGAKGHACTRKGAHKKRCTCHCGARPEKDSTAAREARKAYQELVDELVPQMFPTPEETARAEQERKSPWYLKNHGSGAYDHLGPEDIH